MQLLTSDRHVPSSVASMADIVSYTVNHPELERPYSYENMSLLLQANASEPADSDHHRKQRTHLRSVTRKMIDEALVAHNVSALVFPSHFTYPTAFAGQGLTCDF